MKKKKEYTNIFARMAEYHNTEVVSFIKEFTNDQSIKIRRQRVLQFRDKAENSDNIIIDHELIYEYVLTNLFFFKLIDKSQYHDAISLIESYDKANVLIGANILYGLIEEKKAELLKNNENMD